ncbi:DUF3991 and TOPRIM domain-containing protein [Paenibacillus sp. 11B]|uniref:DUF3991 and TOPRIM domain-containing protein n=1 Tax=Paenibacillus sp. 11B TaxID=3060965 RepID=UPI00264DB108|nr:DUF3991 and TOPRIM domain-containing protein [Paenibacillus sp. 11B]MDN8588116.1 DUF3991 and TOPRIM domain-containing protein [Paenibacillus sp. 11B]
MPSYSKVQLTQANNINLIDLAKFHGYILQNGGRRALHAKQSGGLYFFKNSNKYYHFSTDTHGGPIDFVMQFWNMNFKEAVAFLLESEIPLFAPVSPPPPTAGRLILPDKASNYRRVAWYLVHVRGIDPEIMSHLMHEKKLYQQNKTGNCVFVGYNQDGIPKYCSMRGCNPNRSFKQDRIHSDKSSPFHISGNDNSTRVYVFESPIDAISHATLYKLNALDWRADHRISLGCLSDNALERFLSQHTIQEIIFCFDNDYNATYRDGSPAPNWGQEAAFKFAHKYDELGYQTSIQTPHNKDFNVDLVTMRQPTTEAKSSIHEEDCEYEL